MASAIWAQDRDRGVKVDDVAARGGEIAYGVRHGSRFAEDRGAVGGNLVCANHDGARVHGSDCRGFEGGEAHRERRWLLAGQAVFSDVGRVTLKSHPQALHEFATVH